MSNTPWTAVQSRAQYGAVARLRWQMYRNSFRRKGGKGDLVANLVVAPFALIVLLGLCVAAWSGTYFAISTGHPEAVSWVLWGIFLLSQLLNLNLGQPGTTFDPTQLIRFPLRVGDYIVIRLFFGVLSPGNILSTMMSLSAAIGVIVAAPGLWAYALLALAVFAAVNVLFTRMVFSWVDRWLSTRRAREVFTGLIFLFSMGVQFLNFAYNPAYHNKKIDKHKVFAFGGTLAKIEPYMAVLPPELTGGSLEAAHKGHPQNFAFEIAGDCTWGLLFLGVFALRMRVEYRGENLSDHANAVAAAKPKTPRSAAIAVRPQAPLTGGFAAPLPATTPSVLSTMFGKELLYLRRNIGLFYGLLMPLVMVIVFAGKFAGRHNTKSSFLFPAAVAYGLLGVFPMSFNSFGLDTTGAQFYFLAPVRLRDVMLGKNALVTLILVLESGAILGAVCYVATSPSISILLATVLWATATMFVQLTVGNYQSISSPKKIDPGRTAQKQARPASAFASMGILLGAALVGWACLALASFLSIEWVLPLMMLLLALAGAFIYWTNLNKLDLYALQHRDALFEELGKKS